MNFAGVCLIAEYTPALAAFYQALFGKEGNWEGEDHVDFPGTGIAIFSVRGMEEMAPGSTLGIGSGKAVLSFDVPVVDSLVEKLISLGAQIVKPPQTHPWGLRSVWIKDPEGNIISLRCPVK
jgi:predicted enzyme related to lactoylglutathione lyase